MDKKFEKTSKSFIEEDKTTIKIRLYFIIRFILEHHTTSIRPFVDRFKQIFNENWLVAYLNICMCIVPHQKLSIIQNNIVIAKHNSIIEKNIIMTFTSLIINKLILMKNSWVFKFFLNDFAHLPSNVHCGFDFTTSHGTCIMNLEIISWHKGSIFIFGISVKTIEATSSAIQHLNLESSQTKICLCGKPFFWNSIAHTSIEVQNTTK